MPNPLDLTNVNVSASFQNVLQIDGNGNPYNLIGNQITSMTLRSTIYPLISFSAIDYTLIPANAFLIGFDSDAGNKLTKLDNAGNLTIIEGAGGGGGIITGISDTNTIDLAIISGDLSAVVKYQNSSDILLSSDGFGLIASFASTDISQFTNDSGYITLASLSSGTGISYNPLTGEITNSAPDQTVVLTQGGTTTITGTYPNFTISSADQFTGTVTSVAALTLGTTGTDLSSSVANSTTTPVITLNVPTASATNRGALSSADWTTFNNKVSSVSAGTNISITGTATDPIVNRLNSERRNDWNAPYSYCGTAPNGSAESANVWTIYRIQVANDGTVTTLSATNVAWTNRYSVIYT